MLKKVRWPSSALIVEKNILPGLNKILRIIVKHIQVEHRYKILDDSQYTLTFTKKTHYFKQSLVVIANFLIVFQNFINIFKFLSFNINIIFYPY